MDYSDEIQHKKKRRRLKATAAVFLFLLVVLIGSGAYLWFYTDFFYFTDIEISGLKSLKREEVLPKDKLSFFENIDLTNTLIRTSRVNKNYISKKLNINIEEREPYAIWCQSSPLVLQAVNIEVATSTEVATSSVGNISDSHVGVPDVCYWFDKDGFMFAEAPETEGVLIRSVHDVSGREIQTGNYILPNEQKNMLFKILEFVDAAGIKVKYFQLEPIEKQEVTAVSAAGPAIYFSLRLDPAFALEPVRTLVPTLPGLKYVDLRSENKVFYK